MGRLKFTLTNFWFWMTMAIGCFFVENIALLTPKPTDGFDFTTFWIFAIAAFACALMYIVLERKRNHIGVDKVLLPTMILLFTVMVVTIWAQGTYVFPFANGKDEIVVTFTFTQKIQYSTFLFFVFIFTYMSTAMMFSNRTSNRSLRWLPFLYILFTYITVFCSLFMDWPEYIKLFQGDTPRAKAFYLNANTYAIALFIGILSCMVFNHYTTTTFGNVTIIVFTLAQSVTNCASSVLLTVVVVPIYFFVNIIHNAKQHYIKTAIYCAFALAVYLPITSFSLFHGQWMEGIEKNFAKFVASFDFDTFTNRVDIWWSLIDKSIDTPWHAIFGHGFMTGDILLNAVCRADANIYVGGSHSGENGFVNIMFCHGLIGLLIYVLLLGYFAYCLICILMKKRYYTFIIYGICFFSMCAYNMVEKNLFFDMGFKETYITLAFYMPVIHMHKMDIHRSKVKEFKELPGSEKRDYFHFPHLASMILAGLTATAGAGLLITGVFKFQPLFNTLLYVTIGLAAALFLLPYMLYLWLLNKGRTRGKVHVILNFVGILFVSFIVMFIFKYNLIAGAIALGATMIGDLIVYAIVEKDLFRSYFRVNIMNAIVRSLLPMVISIGLAFLLAFLFKGQTEYNMLTYIAFMVVAFVFFAMAMFIIPNKENKEAMEYLNGLLMFKYRVHVKLERRTKVCLKQKIQAELK